MGLEEQVKKALAGLPSKRRGSVKRCQACGGKTRAWAGQDWCPRCFKVVDAKARGGKKRHSVAKLASDVSKVLK